MTAYPLPPDIDFSQLDQDLASISDSQMRIVRIDDNTLRITGPSMWLTNISPNTRLDEDGPTLGNDRTIAIIQRNDDGTWVINTQMEGVHALRRVLEGNYHISPVGDRYDYQDRQGQLVHLVSGFGGGEDPNIRRAHVPTEEMNRRGSVSVTVPLATVHAFIRRLNQSANLMVGLEGQIQRISDFQQIGQIRATRNEFNVLSYQIIATRAATELVNVLGNMGLIQNEPAQQETHRR